MARRGLHWFWRGAIATVISCVLIGVGFRFDLFRAAYEILNPWIRGWITWVADYNIVMVPLLVGMPAIILAFLFYALLSRYAGPRENADRETRCRNCGYILRGLREPVCSECGERI